MGTLIAGGAHSAIAHWLYREPAGQLYHWWWVMLGGLVSAWLLAWLWQRGGKALPAKGREEVEELAVSA
jgi:hypothetical protein